MFRQFWRWLVRTGFRLLYNEMAWSYDIVSWLVSLGEWQKWQESALPFVEGVGVLEIAHGPGHMLSALGRSGHQAYGLDLSPHMGRIARRRLLRAGYSARLVQGKAQELPFASHTFHAVLCTFPTYFIAEKRTTNEVHRVLRPGGRFIIVPEGYLRGKGPAQRFIAWLYKITGQGDGTGISNGEWQADAARWQLFRQSFEEAGFSVEVQPVLLARSVVTVIIATRPQTDSRLSEEQAAVH